MRKSMRQNAPHDRRRTFAGLLPVAAVSCEALPHFLEAFTRGTLCVRFRASRYHKRKNAAKSRRMSFRLAGPTGLEPATSGVTGRGSRVSTEPWFYRRHNASFWMQ